MYQRVSAVAGRYRVFRVVAKNPLRVLRRCRREILFLARSWLIGRYLESGVAAKLHLGAGPNLLEGWMNTDLNPSSWSVVFLDATKRFPMKACTFQYVFSEHQIEHLTYDEGRFMLWECYRVLKPAGRIRIATPDVEAFVGLYSDSWSAMQEKYVGWTVDVCYPEAGAYNACFALNSVFGCWGHRFVYDRSTLRHAMTDAGFIDIEVRAVGESPDESLRGIERHGDAAGSEDINRFETVVLEGRRPD